MDLKKHIGLKIKAARLKRGWTQAQLADRLNKAVETVSNIERGAVFTALETLEHISQLLGVPMGFFFEGVEQARSIKKSQAEAQQQAKDIIDTLSENQLVPVIALLKATASRPAKRALK